MDPADLTIPSTALETLLVVQYPELPQPQTQRQQPGAWAEKQGQAFPAASLSSAL